MSESNRQSFSLKMNKTFNSIEFDSHSGTTSYESGSKRFKSSVDKVEEWLKSCESITHFQPIEDNKSIEPNEESDDSITPSDSISNFGEREEENYGEYKVPEREVKKFRVILCHNSNGLSITDFRTLYRQLYDCDVSDFGFSSVIEMIFRSKVFSIEAIEDPNDQRLDSREVNRYLLYDSRHKSFQFIPKTIQPKDEPEVRAIEPSIPIGLQISVLHQIKSSKRRLHLNELNVDYKGFDSRIDFFKCLSQLIPIKVIDNKWLELDSISSFRHFISELAAKRQIRYIKSLVRAPTNSLIPGIPISQLSAEDVFNRFNQQIVSVYLSYYPNPESFCGIIDNKEFKKLIENMTEFYEKDINGKNYYNIPEEFLINGFYCAVKCPQNGWIRVQIIDTSDDNKIKVLAFDFGYKLIVKANDLRLLRLDFSSLPSQLIQFSINGFKLCENIKPKKYRKQFQKLLAKHRDRSETFGENFCQFVSLIDNRIEIIVFETDDLYEYYSIGDYCHELGLTERTDSYVSPNWDLLYEAVQKLYKIDDCIVITDES